MRLIPLVLALFAVGCTSPTKKAQNLIRQHLETNLPDWDSYQSVEFGNLDTMFLSLYIPEYIELLEKSGRFRELKELDILDGQPVMLQMKHIYRCTDGYGRKTINHALYYFDLGLTKIENCEIEEPN